MKDDFNNFKTLNLFTYIHVLFIIHYTRALYNEAKFHSCFKKFLTFFFVVVVAIKFNSQCVKEYVLKFQRTLFEKKIDDEKNIYFFWKSEELCYSEAESGLDNLNMLWNEYKNVFKKRYFKIEWYWKILRKCFLNTWMFFHVILRSYEFHIVLHYVLHIAVIIIKNCTGW